MVDKEKIQEERIRKAEPYEGYWEESYEFVFQKLEKYFSNENFSKAIEFGSGAGKFFPNYAKYFEEVTAIESDWKSRDKAMENAYWNDMKHIEFRSSEDDGGELKEDSFDFIFVGQPFRHMKLGEADGMIEKAGKLLRPGGVLVIFAPHLKRGQERFLKTYIDEGGDYTTEQVNQQEFKDIDPDDKSELGIQRFKPQDFRERKRFDLKNIFYFHDTILPRFVDNFFSRDSVINIRPFKGFFGSEMAVVLEKT